MGPIERALDLLRSAGVVEVTLRVDLGRGVSPLPLTDDCSRHPACRKRSGHAGVCLDTSGRDIDGTEPSARRVVEEALADAADEFSHTGARVTRDAPPRPDDGDEEGDDADEP